MPTNLEFAPVATRRVLSSVRVQRHLSVAMLTTLAAALTGLSALPASAITSTDSTDANVVVSSVITLTGLPASFSLSGIPGAIAGTGGSPVTMNVETNNTAGYSVTVQAAAAELLPADTLANTDSIAIADLKVRETGDPTYLDMSDTAPVTVGGKASRSAAGGDTVSNDYNITIPFVNADTYTVTLNYVATTL